jgi:DNA-binding LacI/PurR family transcriptional regulator
MVLNACEFGKDHAFSYHQEKIAEVFASAKRPTALFAGMDMLAIRAMETLRELQLEIPGDVAVFGFDNIEFSPFTHPPLSTVQQPIEDMGRRAAEVLFDRIEGKKRRKVICERLACRLIVRRSCGAAPSS